MTAVMLIGTLSTLSFAVTAADPVTERQSSTMENQNQAGGIVYTKTSTARSDGSIEITLTAHTTGVVTQTTQVTPTDIVLVLDVSGSMDDSYTVSSETVYSEVLGNEYTYSILIIFSDTGYGFNNRSASYYINTGTAQEPHYTALTYTGRDSNGYEMFSYSVGNDNVIVYPKLTSGTAENREHGYDVVQFYRGVTTSSSMQKMAMLKNAVNEFIDTTLQMNTGLDESEMHSISIVKFADNSYFNSSTPTVAEGNEKGAGGVSDYNYSQVVKNLTVVNDTGAQLLKNAVNGLEPGGATAVDYGLALAEEVFKHRSTVVDNAVDRNEVIIVFTDGEPNHQNGFDDDVANDAIAISKNMKTTANVAVYTVCIANGADEKDISSDINKYMHYVSSNFPNAASMTDAGSDGSIDKGFYMTPDDSTSLSMIFDAIIHEIDHPSITLGEEATMVDTLSPYFVFENGSATDVKLQVSRRNADGTWKEPEAPDSSMPLDYVITEDRLVVNGFNFDENFVSETGRGPSGDFYGMRLVVSFIVMPDYDAIDGAVASATLLDGVLPTNYGFASLRDSDQISAADVSSPLLVPHDLTYMVDGVVYSTTHRFEGADVEVLPEPTKEGYKFSGWVYPAGVDVTANSFKMPETDVIISGLFVPEEYTVSYQYAGVVPPNPPALPQTESVLYGSTVTIANAPAAVPGYVFTGWQVLQTDVDVSGNTFTMPAKNVTIVGTYDYSSSTPYTIEHYLETLTDGVYETDPEVTETGFHGTTGHTAVATPLNRFEGFEYNEAQSAATISGTILADGSLALKVYYDRKEYTVSYGYEGDTDIPGLPTPPVEQSYKFGETVTVESVPTAPAGYSFTGWYKGAVNNPVSGTFEMPAQPVHILGFFTENSNTAYKVVHYFEKANGSGYEVHLTQNLTATTGSTVTATPLTPIGLEFVAGASTVTGTVAGDGGLVLNLYYDREKYTVIYEYEGTVPAGAPTLPASADYKFGQTVDIADVPDSSTWPAGYDFVGWYFGDVSNIVTSLEMPAHNVYIRAYFKPAGGVEYNVEHYLMGTDGQYQTSPERTETYTGTTNDTVSANPLTIFEGFTYNADESDASGTIAGDGSLTLKLYYDREKYTVSYKFEGTVPTGLTAPAEVSYYHGADVTLEPGVTAPAGYTFGGWHVHDTDVSISGNQFEMPLRNVVIYGRFTANNDTPYKVEHYLETLTDGVYETDPALTETGFKGTTGHTVTATPLDRFTGFEYNAAQSTATITGTIAGDGSLVLKIYYDRKEYTVSYGYEGEVPTGATPAPASKTYKYGKTVTVESIPVFDGYTFVGWYRGTVNNILGATFEMPAYSVHILGNFNARTDITYTVEHYLQNKDGNGYTLDGIPEVRYGTTGLTATALAKEYPGFTYNSSLSQSSGEVKADGSLVLSFYYDRNTHNVSYQYKGTVPDGADPAPTPLTDVRFGSEVELAGEPSVPGYTFSGWTTQDANVSGNKFDMPDKDVVLVGSFTPNAVDYEVNYWFQKLDAGNTFDPSDYELGVDSYTDQAYVATHVEAISKAYTGFVINTQNSKTYGHVTVGASGNGNLVLNVYYDRLTFDVTYVYYNTDVPANAPSLDSLKKENVRYGTLVDVEDKLVVSGFAFEGWYTHTANVANGQFTMPAHDVIFIGELVEQFSVTYDLQGGTGASGVDYSQVLVDDGTVITVNAAPTRSGYTFKGWKDATDIYNPGDDVTVEKNYMFIAQWSRNPIIPASFKLTYDTNGGSYIASETYLYGETAQLDKVPTKTGHVFAGWHLDKELTEDVEKIYMTSNVTVYAAWTPILDTNTHDAYLMGYPDGTVRPDGNITRAEAAAIFFRLLKADVREANLTTENSFVDVNAPDWYNTAISTMAKLGIVKGRTETEYKPNEFITRAEFAAICARFDDSSFEAVESFTDIGEHWAKEEINEAAARGWVNGYEDNTFRPNNFITRAEAVSMINKVLGRQPETVDDLIDGMITWPDNADTSEWYYLAIQEATNAHKYIMKNEIHEKWTELLEKTDWTKYE